MTFKYVFSEDEGTSKMYKDVQRGGSPNVQKRIRFQGLTKFP